MYLYNDNFIVINCKLTVVIFLFLRQPKITLFTYLLIKQQRE